MGSLGSGVAVPFPDSKSSVTLSLGGSSDMIGASPGEFSVLPVLLDCATAAFDVSDFDSVLAFESVLDFVATSLEFESF
jgi:hypothetical protein